MLLDQKFIEQLVSPHPSQTVLTIQQCRILLTDIACCSLMRLDITSMDKLWDLMVMLFKWQIFHANDDPKKLLDITFRHMDGIGKLLPEMRKTLLIDAAKRRLMEHWDTQTHVARCDIMCSIKQWLQVFHVKISILIRLGFQRADGQFETDIEHLDGELYQSYMDHIGENVYARNNAMRSLEMTKKPATVANQTAYELTGCGASSTAFSHELTSLVDQLNVRTKAIADADDGEGQHLDGDCKGNILLLDDVNCCMDDEFDCDESDRNAVATAKFVHIENAQTTLQKYLDKFRLENECELDERTESQEDSTPFDATEELLKMLDKD